MMLFASLVMDREPMTWAQMPAAIAMWLQNAGGVAAFGVALVVIAGSLSRDTQESPLWNLSQAIRPLMGALKTCVFIAGAGYLVLMLAWLGNLMRIPRLEFLVPHTAPGQTLNAGDYLMSICGGLALFVALTPIMFDLATRISWGRIWAIAMLSWKEAVRGRVIWVFGAMAIVFLFADWFVTYKPENQLRNYVRVVYWSMTPLFLLTAGLLGSFSIPNDVRNNSIHTIVTKPVEKFEVVLGRFVGYACLLTVGLLVVSLVSLIYLVREINPDATKESYRAREPIYGKLHFLMGGKSALKGDNVGREWTYRSYITGPTRRQKDSVKQYAIWDFDNIPSDVIDRPNPTLFEYAFDIFRLSKGEVEGAGVNCSFMFTDGRDAHELENLAEIVKKERDKLAVTGMDDDKIDLEIAKNHRVFEARNKEVTDYHTQEFVMPPGVLSALLANLAERRKENPNAPAMRVFVSVDVAREAQMVGVAQQDFYLLAHERPFWLNFLKGIIGMWCTHMLVLGIALACSTYLSSVISFLGTMFLYVTGLNVDYLKEIAEKRVDGGGPVEAIIRISTHMPVAGRLDDSPTKTVVGVADDLFSWWIGRIMNLIPDVGRHDLHQYVANGFDISWLDVLLLDNFLPLCGYLAPWAIVAYYLMKYREIANPS
jgi:hypothetical protein